MSFLLGAVHILRNQSKGEGVSQMITNDDHGGWGVALLIKTYVMSHNIGGVQ